MWIISILFVAALWLAHVAIGMPLAATLYMSEMRPLTPFAHLLFLLLIAAGLSFAHQARRARHNISALLGLAVALSILIAWMTPTVSPGHDFFATAPFFAIFAYVLIMLFHGGYYLSARVLLALAAWLNGFAVLAFGWSGELQKANALLFLALLNFLCYRVLPSTSSLIPPLYYHDPNSKAPKGKTANCRTPLVNATKYKELTTEPDAFSRAALAHSAEALQHSLPEIAHDIRNVLGTAPIPKPPLHDAGSDSDFFHISLRIEKVDAIADALLSAEAGAVAADGSNTPQASHYATLVDIWSRYRDHLQES